MSSNEGWYYFGCHQVSGHYVFTPGMRRTYQGPFKNGRDLSRFDGMLAPQGFPDGYIATVTRLEGWNLTALSFWDYSVDKRGASNSIVFAPGLHITSQDLLVRAAEVFPQVFGRLPQPVKLRSTAA